MSASLESRPYAMPQTARIAATRGVGLAIVHADSGRLWVQRDLGKRAQTGRDDGLLSITFETQKVGEDHRSNVLGALPEVVDDEILPRVRDRLHTTDGLVSTDTLRFDHRGKHIEYAVAVAVFNGSEEPFSPHVVEEAAPFGWLDPQGFLGRDDIRPLARHAVGHLTDNGILAQKIAEFHDPDYPTELIIPKGFEVAAFHERREQTHDMIPGVLYPIT